MQRVARGELTGVSIGYRRDKVERSGSFDRNTYREDVTKWTFFEVSLVPLPADPAAKVRGLETMEEEDEVAVQDRPADNMRSRPQGAPRVTTANRAEQARITEIRSIATAGGFDDGHAEAAIRSSLTAEEYRQNCFRELAERSRNNSTSSIRSTEAAGVFDTRHRVEDQAVRALANLMDGRVAAGENNPFSGRGAKDIARGYLNDPRASENDVVAFMVGDPSFWGGRSRGMHTTSDFPTILSAAAGLVLVEAFNASPTPLKTLSRQRDAIDFRPQTMVRPGEVPMLVPVTESGEIKHGTFGEESQAFKLQTFARNISLSREVLVNDATGAIADRVNNFATAAIATEAAEFFGLLSANSFGGKTLADGLPFFHADHGNRAATGTLLEINALSAARQAMRLQKGVDGVQNAGVTPAYLVVGPKLETQAEAVTAALAAATVGDVNPFAGRLKVLVVNEYAGNGWWLFGDPATRPALVHGYLNGRAAPQVETQEGWNRFGIELRCFLDFGCGVQDWRAAYFNPGVAE
jgi:hypothetical protein